MKPEQNPFSSTAVQKTYGIDCSLIEKAVTKKTKAVIPVHLYGNPCDMETLCELAKNHKLDIIEDCAQAHLATYKDRPVGMFGRAGTFSFYPGKNLGACGDAGFVLTDTETFLQKVSMHVDHGRKTKYSHDFMAGNYRMDDIQAAILSVKCKYITQWTELRIQAAKKYNDLLGPYGLKVIEVLPEAKCVYHLYVVEVDCREKIMKEFKAQKIGCGIHYPIPMSLQPACSFLGHKKGDFPVSEKVAERILSLPMYPELTETSIKNVTEFLK